jgi:hypothetical protein
MKMRRIALLKLVAIFLISFLSAAALYAQGGRPAPKYIYVDAVGVGATKEEALNAAFS